MSCQVLLISGSLRAGSTNSALLRTAAAVAPSGVEAVTFGGLDRLPHFNPDDDPDGGPLDPEVCELRRAIADVDAVLISTPEYAGALPGSLKNLLEWTIGGGEIYGKPVAWVNASGPAAPTGAADAHESLRKVLEYAGAEIVEDACARIPVLRDSIGEDGLIADPQIRLAIAAVLESIAAHVASGREGG